MNERRIDVGSVSLAVAEAGEGGRPLLLVHGFTGAKEDFTDYLDRLADDGWHAVAPDHRGHGASDKPEGIENYSIDILSNDLLVLADTLWGDAAPFTLLGHSMGGMVAQTIALQRPSRLRGLILMDTGHGPLRVVERDLALAGAGVAREQGMAKLHELIEERGDVLRTPADQRLRDTKPGYTEFADRKFLNSSPSLYEGMMIAMLDQEDRVDALKTLDLPTLVIVGEQDKPFIKPSERMAAAIPGAQLAVIDDAGHSPQFENPDAWWSALSGFLASLPAAVQP
jgi:2-succinyl-6-hydroxy-2,4-cyclohexadiene-1-carboxylate synthase